MKLIIVPTTPGRIEMIDGPIPHVIDQTMFPSWSERELEKYGQTWAKCYITDIVMLEE